MIDHKRESDTLLAKIHNDLKDIRALQEQQKTTIDEMRDILIIWNNTKGFINVIRVLGTVAKWVVSVAVAIGAVWYWAKR